MKMKKLIKTLCIVFGGIICLFSQNKEVSATTMLGDLNGSNKIELADVQISLKAALNIVSLDSDKQIIADVNEDGALNLKDTQLVLMRALNIIDTFDLVYVDNVTISKSSATINVGETLSLTATAYPSNAFNKQISWSSSNNKIATVSNGVVKGVGAGVATITAKVGNYSATCEVTVKNYNTSSSNDYKYAKMAMSVIYDNLKNPYSLVIHSASAYTAWDGSRTVVINYSATNSFGGRVASYIRAGEAVERLYYPDYQIELGKNSYLSVSTFNGTVTVGTGDYCNNLDVNTIWSTDVGTFTYYRGL